MLLTFGSIQQRPVQPFAEEGLFIPSSTARAAIGDVKEEWPLVALAPSR